MFIVAHFLQCFFLGFVGPREDVIQLVHALLDGFDLLVGERFVKRDDELIQLIRHFRIFADVVNNHIKRTEHEQAA